MACLVYIALSAPVTKLPRLGNFVHKALTDPFLDKKIPTSAIWVRPVILINFDLRP